MRRLLAVLALASLTNLVFVQGGQACPLNGDASAMASGHGTHDGAGGSGSPMAPEHAPDSPDLPRCLTMGPCAVALDISPVGDVAAQGRLHSTVIGVSEHRPASRSTAPALPPPRA